MSASFNGIEFPVPVGGRASRRLFDGVIADADRKIASALQVPARVLLSRTDLLALAASAKTRQERQRYRRMAEDV